MIGGVLFSFLLGGLRAPQPIEPVDLVGMLLYIAGSYIGTASEHSRYIWKARPENQGHPPTEGLFSAYRSGTPRDEDSMDDRRAIREVLHHLIAAWNSADACGFASAFLPSAEYVTGSGIVIHGRDGIVELVKQARPSSPIALRDQPTIEYEGSTGTARFGWSETARSIAPRRGIITCTLVRHGTRWQIEGLHNEESWGSRGRPLPRETDARQGVGCRPIPYPDEGSNMRTNQAAPKNIDEYIAGFPPDVQEILEKIRRTIRKAAPGAEETINYQIPTFTLKGNMVHFAAFKNHIGFYPTPTGIKKFKNELSDYEGGKGSVKFPLDKAIPFDLISKIVKFRVKQNLERAEAKGKKK